MFFSWGRERKISDPPLGLCPSPRRANLARCATLKPTSPPPQHGRLCCPARGLRGRRWQPRAVRPPRAYPACTSRSQLGVGVLGVGERPPAALVRGCNERPRACATCSARDPRVRGRQPCPLCSSCPLAACTTAQARARARVRLRGVRVRHTARHGPTVRRDPRAGGAHARQGAGRGPTRC